MSNEEFPTDGPAVVTCGLPYANGDLHVGHLRGYVNGDVLNRALKSVGQQTAYVSGSDIHGTPIAVQARQQGIDPETLSMEYHEQYRETFPEFNVDFDNYGHTHDETNTELTREIVETLESEGYVYEKEIKVGWDPETDEPLPDRYVEGTCPYCGARARGDECDEGCGRHLEPGEIEDPVSTITGNPAEYRERTHKFFRVSDLSDYLTGFLDNLEGTSNARNQPRQWIEDGLQDWCITRDLDWGIDYPGEGGVVPAERRDGAGGTGDQDDQDLVLYVWVDAPIEYISSTKQYSERVGADEYDWTEVWGKDGGDGGVSASSVEGSSADRSSGQSPREDDASGGSEDERSDAGGEIIHVIGRDIIQHHTIFWPAMLEVADYAAPRAVCATGFITIGGKGLSTSRNRAIWAREYLDEGFHSDCLRYYLATNGGFQQDVDFSWEKFADRVNGELVGTLGNFLYRSLLFAHRNFGGTPGVSESHPETSETESRPAEVSAEVRERIEDAQDAFRAAVNDYSVKAIGQTAVELAGFGNEYIQRNEPWKLGDDEAAPVIRDCVQIAKAVAVLFEPVAPGKAETIWAGLEEEGSVHEVELDAALAAPPAEFDEPTEPFAEVEDDHVAELTAALEDRVAETANDEGETESDEADGDESSAVTDIEPVADDRISFEDFQELDVRVG
jgi:methionyl-tRNA synthetase